MKDASLLQHIVICQPYTQNGGCVNRWRRRRLLFLLLFLHHSWLFLKGRSLGTKMPCSCSRSKLVASMLSALAGNPSMSLSEHSGKQEAWRDSGKQEAWRDSGKQEAWRDSGKQEAWRDSGKQEAWRDSGKQEASAQQEPLSLPDVMCSQSSASQPSHRHDLDSIKPAHHKHGVHSLVE